MAVIETVNLTKHYGNHRGIIDVNLKVEEGEIFGFIGPNGSGKSTFIRTILNFLYPTSGTGKIFGKNIETESYEIKKSIGYVPSEVNYYEEALVSEIMEYAASFHKDVGKADIEYWASELQLDMNKRVEELSLGNKKKLAIAQALMGNPELLILDEPTSGLDPLMQKKLFKLLMAHKEKGHTVFLSSHNLTEVESLCDRVAIIKAGKIIQLMELEKILEGFGLTVELEGDIPAAEIEKIASLILKSEAPKFEFIYRGEISALVKLIADYNLSKLLIKEQNLEDTFLSYYKGKEEK